MRAPEDALVLAHPLNAVALRHREVREHSPRIIISHHHVDHSRHWRVRHRALIVLVARHPLAAQARRLPYIYYPHHQSPSFSKLYWRSMTVAHASAATFSK